MTADKVWRRRWSHGRTELMGLRDVPQSWSHTSVEGSLDVARLSVKSRGLSQTAGRARR